MTPEERALRDAYLAELWPTCPEWKAHPTPRDRRIPCDTCGGHFSTAGLARHIRTAHGMAS